ncbi:hypothetical protein ALPO108162_05015 [Alicyclobacillus pomorum]
MNTKRILTGVTSLLILGTLGLTGCSTNTSTNNEASGVSNSTSKSHTTTHNKNLTSATAALKPQNKLERCRAILPSSICVPPEHGWPVDADQIDSRGCGIVTDLLNSFSASRNLAAVVY